MADNLFHTTRNYVRTLLLVEEFPEAHSVWQKLFTVAGMRQALAERSFLRQNKHRINVLAIAFCSVSLDGGSRDPATIAETVSRVRAAQALDPRFFRENADTDLVTTALEYLKRHEGQAKVTA